ncbi:MAG: tRNA (N6-isopentenyl adenosine(37)-C2)-methylthiotransferase MiaB [Candidatus Delongbacteria bacterium]|nr:tRNA (N6-isopentenyl adenosine(37)-C2)-methylthiotransferase MiaB [Candidatus Delongbacteria bacterium]
MNKTFYIETYGCQMNVVDSEIVTSILIEAGYKLVEDIKEANILLLNTCAIREKAVERVINKMKHHKSLKNTGKLEIAGVLGCIPEHTGDELRSKLDFIKLQVGPDKYRTLPELLKKIYKEDKYLEELDFDIAENYDDVAPYRSENTNAFISVMRGCNNYCSYCVVPYVRGREKSRSIDSIIAEVEQTLANGISEITLLGQNVNSYNFEGIRFPELLQKVAEVKGMRRLKFATSHAKDLSEELIDVIVKNENISNSFHLPFQAGSNEVLKNMNRGYTIEEYLAKIDMIREKLPDIAITTDVIVGFPGETNEDFEKTIKVLKDTEFDNAFMFIYSERKNTMSAKKFKDDVSKEEKGRRQQVISELQKEIGLEQLRKDIGKTKEVLIESVSKKRDDQYKGRTDENRIVIFDKKENCNIGGFVKVKIIKAEGVTLFGEIVNKL